MRELFEDKDSPQCTVDVNLEGTLSQKQVEEVSCIVLFKIVIDYDAILMVNKLLLQAEDDGDAEAASHAKAEQLAEMAEFDENFSANSSNTKVIQTSIFLGGWR